MRRFILFATFFSGVGLGAMLDVMSFWERFACGVVMTLALFVYDGMLKDVTSVTAPPRTQEEE